MDQPVHPGLTDEAIADRLREAGLRVTKSRVAVYRVLHESDGHLSVDEIVELVAARGERYPRMTVYNIIARFLGAGLVMQADAGPGRALYEIAERWHHHFVCRVCGSVYDVPCVVGRKPCLEPDASDIGEVDEAQIIFRGVCTACTSSPHHEN
ncbi:MAG TPA: transcriptional repressor [Phycisphaerales bacterium]|nr:transcriptional repressor [Phycisphaerales bacterium]